ncbi:Uncharacterised protein [Mycobacteroides abscessus subsp. massiliense]|nr:Uncharacterised protein [Mycobacteroides abscessus subsp. massiliense]
MTVRLSKQLGRNTEFVKKSRNDNAIRLYKQDKIFHLLTFKE